MEKISLIYKFAVENYYDTVRKNKGLLTSEGIDVNGVNISLYNFIKEENVKDVLKNLSRICDDSRTEFKVLREIVVDSEKLSISGYFSDFKYLRTHSVSMEENLESLFVLNLYAIDLYMPLSYSGEKKRVPILFTLVNANGVPSILIVESSIKFFDLFKNNIKFKILPLTESLLNDIFQYIVEEEVISGRDCLLLSSYNSLNEYVTITVNKENKNEYSRILTENGYSSDVVSYMADTDFLVSQPIFKFDDDFSGSELKIKSVLTIDNMNFVHDTLYEDYKNNPSNKLVVLQSRLCADIRIDGYTDYSENKMFSVNGRMYEIGNEKYIETENGYDIDFEIIAESEAYIYSNHGAIELLPFHEKAHSYEETNIAKLTESVKEVIKEVKTITRVSVASFKNTRDKVNYVRTIDRKIDFTFRLLITCIGSVTSVALFGPLIGALFSLNIKKRAFKADTNHLRQDMIEVYDEHIRILEEEKRYAEDRNDIKLAMRYKKAINLYKSRKEIEQTKIKYDKKK